MISKMAFSAALCGNLPITSRARRSPQHCHLNIYQKKRYLVITEAQRRNHVPLITSSVLNKQKSDITNGENGPSETATVLLERLFAKTQKLEEIMSKDSSLPEDDDLSIHLLESDLQAALLALKKKEEDLQDAERRVLLENARLNRTKKSMERREREIAAVSAKQKQMEEDLIKGNDNLASHSRQIEDLKILVEEQEMKIAESKAAFSLKEEEMDKLKNDLMKRNEEAATLNFELDSKEHLIIEANKVIEELEEKVEDLKREIGEKEHDLAKSLQLREVEEQRLKIVEANLEKQTVEWLAVREQLKELKEEASKDTHDGTFEEFRRVGALLADVRSELISSQESLALSRKKMDDRSVQFEKQVAELEEQNLLLSSFRKSLKDAQLEVESEKSKLRAAQAKCEELRSQLSAERDLIEHLQQKLKREHSMLDQATAEMVLLREELEQKELEYINTQNLLQRKESELVEARLQIQHLKSEQASIQLVLQEKDVDIFNAQKQLADINHEIAELQTVLNSKSDQLTEATERLREKEEHVLAMQHELDDTKLKFSEATSLVQRVAELTSTLVISAKQEEIETLGLLDEENLTCDMGDNDDLRKQEQVQAELEMVKGLLREREMEFCTARRALIVKDEELRTALRRRDSAEKEMAKLKMELLEDVDAEKLQLEAAQLEAEAATSAMQKLAQMFHQLFEEIGKCTDTAGAHIVDGLGEAENEIARVFALTEMLVMEAGLKSAGV